jgi:hypothetical protein
MQEIRSSYSLSDGVYGVPGRYGHDFRTIGVERYPPAGFSATLIKSCCGEPLA